MNAVWPGSSPFLAGGSLLSDGTSLIRDLQLWDGKSSSHLTHHANLVRY